MEQQSNTQPVAGWYADPRDPARMRYWDGAQWTEQVAPMPAPPATEPVATGSGSGRIAWIAYAVVMTTYLLLGAIGGIIEYGAFFAIDTIVSIPSIMVVYLYAWDRKVLGPLVWRLYAVTFAVWQLVSSFVLQPRVIGSMPPVWQLVVFFVLITPMFYALFRYSFGRWDHAS